MAQDTNLASSVGGGLLALLKGAVQPFRPLAADSVDILNYLKNGQQGFANGYQNPFRSEQELTQNRNQSNMSGFAGDVGRSAMGQLSYGIPFGQGANIATKALLPGATVGLMQGVADPNATAESVLGNTALGGIGAGALHGIFSIPGAIGKTGDLISGAGNTIRQNVNKIETDASIYGASSEKAIQNTLDKLKITGSAQSKYEKLLPAYQGLSDQIEQSLANSPKTIPLDQIRNDLYQNLADKPVLNLTGKEAKQQISSFLDSIYSSGADNPNGIVPTEIGTDKLFKIKQGINADYGQIANKVRNGQPLTDQEKVLSVARKTIDDIIANAHPDVKQATVMQSHLYDAADSLAKSRAVTSSLPIVGKMIPAKTTQGISDLIGRAVQSGGGVLQTGNKVNSLLNNPAISRMVTGAGAGLGIAVGRQYSVGNANNQNSEPENPIGQSSPQATNNYPGAVNNPQANGFSQGVQGNSSISPGVNSNQITPQMVARARLIWPKIKADKIAEAYNAQFAEGKPPDPADAANAKGGLTDLSNVMSTIQSNPGVVLKKSLPGAFGARSYKAAETDMLNNFIYLKTGKQASDAERNSYQGLLPQPGDSQQTINYKLGIFSNYFQQRASGQ